MTRQKLRVAIHRDIDLFTHSNDWGPVWKECCSKYGVDGSFVNCFDYDILSQLKSYDILLWHFNNYVLVDSFFARSILRSIATRGIPVFPDDRTAWHFDNKVAESYLLEAIKAPVPAWWVFYSKEKCFDWLSKEARFPVVFKLRSGSGSNNVRLVESQSEASALTRRMFGGGVRSSPSIFFKAASQAQSAKDAATVLKRLRRVPEFLRTWSRARVFPKEKGYVYFQEFVPNEGSDIKVVVVGEKVSFIGRRVRRHDFRASGSGDLFFDRSAVPKEMRATAREVSQKLGFQCMGIDFVVDSRNGVSKIVEMSYGFSHRALLEAGGYWDRDDNWHDEPLNAPEEVLRQMIERLGEDGR